MEKISPQDQNRNLFSNEVRAVHQQQFNHPTRQNRLLGYSMLSMCGMLLSNITNHIADIRAMFVVYGLNPIILTDSRIALFFKSVRINRPLQPHIVLTLDVPLLEKILPSVKSPSSISSFVFFLLLFILKTA